MRNTSFSTFILSPVLFERWALEHGMAVTRVREYKPWRVRKYRSLMTQRAYEEWISARTRVRLWLENRVMDCEA